MTSVVQAVIEVMKEVSSVKKDGYNTQQNFKFRGVDAVVNALAPAMRRHGVIVIPFTETHELVLGSTTTGKSVLQARVMVKYRIYGPEGDHITARVPGESMDSGDKGTAKAMSVAYRTVLLQSFNLPTDDPDPDEQNYEIAGKQQRQQVQSVPVADMTAWTAAINDCKKDYGKLQALYKEAAADKVAKPILDMIVAAGTAAKGAGGA